MSEALQTRFEIRSRPGSSTRLRANNGEPVQTDQVRRAGRSITRVVTEPRAKKKNEKVLDGSERDHDCMSTAVP